MNNQDLNDAFGAAPAGVDGDGADAESSEPSEEQEDEAIDLAFDPKTDPATRREAFRTAVRLCSKSSY